MNKMPLALIIALIAQLILTNTGFAQDARQNSITGFTFQDNNANGEFDDGDNTFPEAVVHIQAIDGSLIQTAQVTPNGYFAIEGLAASEYVIWTQYLDRLSAEQLVRIGSPLMHANVIIGIEVPQTQSEGKDLNTRSADPVELKKILLPLITR